ncbi:MAG: carbamoyltransferase [Acidimicrobiales bacterium]|nr:carbamoyltransferase [Acidimicrobiales bacterium]
MRILGVSALYHDAAAALVVDGEIVAAAQEERFTRLKNDPALPVEAIGSCLAQGDVPPDGIDLVAYYEKPLTSFVRVLKTFTAVGPRGFRTFPRAMDEALRNKLWASYEIDKALRSLGYERPGKTVYAEHHVSHAAAAFYPSPFDSACILTFDGVGEWATSSIGVGRGRRIDLQAEMRFPHSIGLLYSAFTYAAGFKVNSGEYKLMGLAPFGEPTYRDRILEELIDLRDDGSFTVDLDYFDYLAGRRMTNERFDALLDGPPREPEAPITRRDCDLARSIQDVIEEIVLRMARHGHELTGETRAVLGGGVALNCVANGRLLREGPFDDIWVQPAAGDAGSALGAALWAWHEVQEEPRPSPEGRDAMAGGFLGPPPSAEPVAPALTAAGRPFERLADPEARAARVAGLLAEGAVVGVCTGRMEFGPRALGHRSILADARSEDMQRRLNLKIKNRESFRPFAPVVLEGRAADWFELDRPSPYMSIVAPVRDAGTSATEPQDGGDPAEVVDLSSRLAAVRSPIPAVTHVDGSARIQTVDVDRNPELHRLLEAFDGLTGCPVLVNTSFNVRGEPIVASAEDAYRCFMTTDMDWLLVDDCLLDKGQQPPWEGGEVPTVDD